MLQPAPEVLAGLHKDALALWRNAALQATSLDFFNKGAVMRALQVRAESLAAHEGLMNDQTQLATDARVFADAVASKDPFRAARPWIGAIGAVLGFFGLLSFDKVAPLLTSLADGAEAAGAATGTAVAGLITLISGGVLVVIIRAAVTALQGAAAAFETWHSQTTAAQTVLAPAHEVETKLFAAFGVPVPKPTLSPSQFIWPAAIGAIVGIVVFAFFVGLSG